MNRGEGPFFKLLSTTQVTAALMDLSEQALGLPAGHFRNDSYAKPGTLLRLAYYPGSDGLGVTQAAAQR